jgi:hypothetical protein
LAFEAGITSEDTMAAAKRNLPTRYSTDDPDYGENLYTEAIHAHMTGSADPDMIISAGIMASKMDARDKCKDIIRAWVREDRAARTGTGDQITAAIDGRFWEGIE